MTLCLEKARRAWVRLPRPLHATLLELREDHPRPVVFSTSQFVRFEPRLTDWNLTATVEVPNGINGDPIRAEKLNGLGLAFAKHLGPLSGDRRTLAPLIPLADVLADLPQPVLDWITGPPPIAKHVGGILFEALGVLIPTFRGDAYNPSRELTLAIAELAQRKAGGAIGRDGPAASYLDPKVADILRRILDENGVPWKDAGIDGRHLRSIASTDGAGLVYLRVTADTETSEVKDQEWAVPHPLKPVARALVDGVTNQFELVTLLPDSYREWVASGLPINLVPAHPRLLALIGVIRKKGKYDWQFTVDGRDIQPRLAAFLRASDTGGIAPDDTPYEGEGVGIMLPDVGGDGPADLTLDADEDPWAALDLSPTRPVIEAPVPSNADLAAAKERRAALTEDHRQDYLDSEAPVADLALEDDFDI